ncbi:MAG: DUF2750 domain-containing protein [Saprospiraceae bacterium]|nr:DUF2750 domain-containing protein [Saprospiraceae bacterium]
MTQDEINSVFKKPGEKRYSLFIREVVKSEVVYGLSDEEGWALLGDDNDDADIIPLFPGAEYAEAFRIAAEFEEYNVEALDVNELMEWLDEMEEDKLLVAVFPNTEFNGVVVEPSHLKADLQKEFDKEVE